MIRAAFVAVTIACLVIASSIAIVAVQALGGWPRFLFAAALAAGGITGAAVLAIDRTDESNRRLGQRR